MTAAAAAALVGPLLRHFIVVAGRRRKQRLRELFVAAISTICLLGGGGGGSSSISTRGNDRILLVPSVSQPEQQQNRSHDASDNSQKEQITSTINNAVVVIVAAAVMAVMWKRLKVSTLNKFCLETLPHTIIIIVVVVAIATALNPNHPRRATNVAQEHQEKERTEGCENPGSRFLIRLGRCIQDADHIGPGVPHSGTNVPCQRSTTRRHLIIIVIFPFLLLENVFPFFCIISFSF